MELNICNNIVANYEPSFCFPISFITQIFFAVSHIGSGMGSVVFTNIYSVELSIA